MRRSNESEKQKNKSQRALEFAEERMELLDTVRLVVRDEIEKWAKERGKEEIATTEKHIKDPKTRKIKDSSLCSWRSSIEKLFRLNRKR